MREKISQAMAARTKLEDERDVLRREWIELEDKNDLIYRDRINEINDRIEEINDELGIGTEIIITVRGGVAERWGGSDNETLVTIIDCDGETDDEKYWIKSE